MQLQVLGLVRQRVDVRARVLRHHQHARRARTTRRLGHPSAVLAVQEVVEPRRVGRVDGHAGVAGLLEVEDPGGPQRLDKRLRRHDVTRLLAISIDDSAAREVVRR